jgi:hypothetical protein
MMYSVRLSRRPQFADEKSLSLERMRLVNYKINFFETFLYSMLFDKNGMIFRSIDLDTFHQFQRFVVKVVGVIVIMHKMLSIKVYLNG